MQSKQLPNDDLYCPAQALSTEALPPIKDIPKGGDAFKLWAGDLASQYSKGKLYHEILLDCWNREAAKRAGK